VTYADDLVILCKRGKAEEALLRMREIMSKLKLTSAIRQRTGRPSGSKRRWWPGCAVYTASAWWVR
jgi:hypothetical protein